MSIKQSSKLPFHRLPESYSQQSLTAETRDFKQNGDITGHYPNLHGHQPTGAYMEATCCHASSDTHQPKGRTIDDNASTLTATNNYLKPVAIPVDLCDGGLFCNDDKPQDVNLQQTDTKTQSQTYSDSDMAGGSYLKPIAHENLQESNTNNMNRTSKANQDETANNAYLKLIGQGSKHRYGQLQRQAQNGSSGSLDPPDSLPGTECGSFQGAYMYMEPNDTEVSNTNALHPQQCTRVTIVDKRSTRCMFGVTVTLVVLLLIGTVANIAVFISTGEHFCI